MTLSAFQERVDHFADSEHVKINPERLEALADFFKAKTQDEWKAGISDWDFYLSDKAKGDGKTTQYDPAQALYELVLSTSQNAGYTDQNNDGTTRKWGIEKRGKVSGSSGWISLFNWLRDNDRLPGFNVTGGLVEPAVRRALEGKDGPEALRGQPIPFIEERIEIFKELCSLDAEITIKKIMRDAAQPDGSYKLTMENCVEPLAKAFPKAFGEIRC